VSVDHDRRRRRQVLARQAGGGADRGQGRVEMAEDGRLGLRTSLDLEVHLGNDAEGAQRADVELHQVVARDILDHLAAGARHLSRRVRHGDADHPVPNRAVARPAESIRIRRHHAAHGGTLGTRRIQWEALALRGQRGLQIGESHPGLDPAGEVGGLVLQHASHAFGRERDLVTPWDRTQSHLRAAAPHDDGGRPEVAQAKARRRIPGILGPHHL